MTPKEKAQELYDKYVGTEGRLHIQLKLTGFTEVKRKAKKHSLIAVEEMLGEYQSMSDLESKIVINDEVRFIVHQLQYWMEVKQNIEKL
jgi:hypothetical protein